MDIMICPHCRRRGDRPLFLPRAQQQIFDFIWDNPGCTVKQIGDALYAKFTDNLIGVQLSKIRKHLEYTHFRLTAFDSPSYNKPGKAPQCYKITEVTDGNVEITTLVP